MAQQQAPEFADFEVDVNLEGVEAWGGEGFKLPPEGNYALRVANLTQKPSSKGQPMIVVEYIIEDEGEANGMRVWNNYSLQPQSLGRLKQFSVACGAQLAPFVASQHMGALIRADVVHVDGQPSIGPDGNPRPARVFANVVNETPIEEAQPEEQPVQKPPVMRGKPPTTTAKPAVNGTAPRRA